MTCVVLNFLKTNFCCYMCPASLSKKKTLVPAEFFFFKKSPKKVIKFGKKLFRVVELQEYNVAAM